MLLDVKFMSMGNRSACRLLNVASLESVSVILPWRVMCRVTGAMVAVSAVFSDVSRGRLDDVVPRMKVHCLLRGHEGPSLDVKYLEECVFEVRHLGTTIDRDRPQC
jgi:hypothetical protein